jgi:hypothetical protein
MVVKMVVRPIGKLSEWLDLIHTLHRRGLSNAVDDAVVRQVGQIRAAARRGWAPVKRDPSNDALAIQPLRPSHLRQGFAVLP